MDGVYNFGDSMASNAFVIHGNHTESGKPIIATDPHLSA